MSDPKRPNDPKYPGPISSEDLALYAMQLLPKEESAEVAAHLAQSAEARQELAEILGDLAVFAHTVDLHTPPAQTRERLIKQLGREKKAVLSESAAVAEPPPEAAVTRRGTVFAEAAERIKAAQIERPEEVRAAESDETPAVEEMPKRGVAGRVLPWIGWAVAAGLAVAAGNLYHERDGLRNELTEQATQMDQMKAETAAQMAAAEPARQVMETMKDSSAMRVTLTTYKASTAPIGRATYVSNQGALIFMASNMAPLQPTKAYELWLMPMTEGMKPIPAGMFVPDEHGNASVIMPSLPKGVEAKGFAVTMEDEGGATTPTMPIVLSGE